MVAKVFCDTNIILRAYHSVFPQYALVSATFDRLIESDTELWISRQVIREYLVQLTHARTFDTPFTGEKAVQQVYHVLQTCHVADETHITTQNLLQLIKEYPVSGKQIHDANIVAAMLTNGIYTLLTLNAADFNRYRDKINVVAPGQNKNTP